MNKKTKRELESAGIGLLLMFGTMAGMLAFFAALQYLFSLNVR